MNEAALNAFGIISRELGCSMFNLVATQSQVWLAQAPMSDCMETLRKLPVVPGQFGPEAEHSKQLSHVSEASSE